MLLPPVSTTLLSLHVRGSHPIMGSSTFKVRDVCHMEKASTGCITRIYTSSVVTDEILTKLQKRDGTVKGALSEE